MKVICPYCDKPARLVGGAQIYPHREDLWHRKFYVCNPCDARVGCHNDTVKPYGRLANATLREARGRAHDLFDPLWRGPGLRRNSGYAWMAEVMGLTRQQAHIGMFDLDQCNRLIEIIESTPGNPVLDWVNAQTPELDTQAQQQRNQNWIQKIKTRLFPEEAT